MTAAPVEAPRGELTVRSTAMPADTNANGDIVGAEKLRDSVLKFTDDNSDVLNRLTGFRGTDPVTRRAAEQAMSLVSQSFLDEKTSAMFDPRLNP